MSNKENNKFNRMSTSKSRSFRVDLFDWSGRGEDGRLPSLILSAPEMEPSESDEEEASELD